MDGFRVVKLSEVIRQMDVVITCTGTPPHTVTSITSASMIIKYSTWGLRVKSQTFHQNNYLGCYMTEISLEVNHLLKEKQIFFKLNSHHAVGAHSHFSGCLRHITALFHYRQQERGHQRTAWPNEEWLHRLQHGTFQHWDWCGNLTVCLYVREFISLKFLTLRSHQV